VKFERSREWWMARAAREGNHLIVAGVPTAEEENEVLESAMRHHALHSANVLTGVAASEEPHIAFGRFVNLIRRQRGSTIEEFAAEMQIETGEILAIEENVHHVPEPRTVYRLALAFRIPQERLMQVAGLAKARDRGLGKQAVRFAASADSTKQLSPEEIAALEAFVAVLSRRDSTDR
jgi:HTH-type transcriptional regulator, competence development regulator